MLRFVGEKSLLDKYRVSSFCYFDLIYNHLHYILVHIPCNLFSSSYLCFSHYTCLCFLWGKESRLMAQRFQNCIFVLHM